MPSNDRPRNSIEFHPFNKPDFSALVRALCHAPSYVKTNRQTTYLGNYLERLGAQCLVVERHYIDRYYIEEFGQYYSRCFIPRKNSSSRIHVFSRKLDERRLNRALRSAAMGRLGLVEDLLGRAYLGYIVIRPMASVPIGRTVLRPLEDDDDRVFECAVNYHTHFLGLELKVRGLAFQQQDRAVAACATTAAWYALQRLCRHEGSKAPTTSAITEAAVRHYIPQGRPFPSRGLYLEQVLDAMRLFDFPAENQPLNKERDVAKLILNVYLRSGIPVILALRNEKADYGHAVTVIGYRQKRTLPPEIPLIAPGIGFYNANFDFIYLHDDQLGPYAKGLLRKGVFQKQLELVVQVPGSGPDKWTVEHALVPLYPKLRMNAEQLLTLSAKCYDFTATLAAEAKAPLGMDLFFLRSGTYLKQMHAWRLDPARAIPFLKTISLSRYVGITRSFVGGVPFMDVLWDTTDTMRRESVWTEHLLGMVALHPKAAQAVTNLAGILGAVAG